MRALAPLPIGLRGRISSDFNFLEDRLQSRRDVRAGEAHRNISMQEAYLVAAIVARATGEHGVEGDLSDEPRERIRQLDLIAGTALLPIEFRKDFRHQDIPAYDAKPRRRFFGRGLFHDRPDFDNISPDLSGVDDAVAPGLGERLLFRRYDHPAPYVFVRFYHPRHAARAADQKVVGQEDGKRFVADEMTR